MRLIWTAVLVVPHWEETCGQRVRDAIDTMRRAAGSRTVVDVILVVGGANPRSLAEIKSIEAGVPDFESIVLGRRISFLEGALVGVEHAIGERIFVVDPAEIDPETASGLFGASGDVIMVRGDDEGLAFPVRAASKLIGAVTGYRDTFYLNSFALSRNAGAVLLESDVDAEMFRSMVAGMGLSENEVVGRRASRRISVRRSIAYVFDRVMERSDMALRTVGAIGVVMAVMNLVVFAWALLLSLSDPSMRGVIFMLLSATGLVLFMMLAMMAEYMVRTSRLSGSQKARVVYRGRSSERTRDEIPNLA